MKLTDAYDFLKENKGKLLGELRNEYKKIFPEYSAEMKINKGGAGQFLELLIGLKNTSAPTDFTDGELKTNKCDASGKALETMFISQISKYFDDLISPSLKFEDSWIYRKIHNLLYVPICKVGDSVDTWHIQAAYHICLDNNPGLRGQLEHDFMSIRQQLIQHIETSKDGMIHTSSGQFIQIRSKDSKRADGSYNPIFSKSYNRHISNKNHAFYFRKTFMDAIKSGKLSVVKIT